MELYSFESSAFGTFLMRQHYLGMPRSLEEAARLDGAGEIGELVPIVAPQTGPALVAVGVILVILSYNEYLFAAFVTQSADSRTVPVVISLMLSERVQDFGKVAAASLMGAIPPLAIAGLLQKRLVEGLTSGAVK
ncbi:MAG: carbohydrate ABC transporter permease [Microbacterium gubbeenense]